MDAINKHYNFLIDKYNLKSLYNKYILFNYLFIICNQSIYWGIILFNMQIKDNPHNIVKYISIIIGLVGLNIILDKYVYTLLHELKNKTKTANILHYTTILSKLSKNDLLHIDITSYNKAIDDINNGLYYYILNIKKLKDVPIIFMRLILIAYKINYPFIVLLGIIYYNIINHLYEKREELEYKENELLLQKESKMRNYILNSKNTLINNDFNMDYLKIKLAELEINDQNVSLMTVNTNTYSQIGNYIFIIITIYNHIHKINMETFYYYLMLIYDISHITSNLSEYYRHKTFYTKNNNTISYLNKFKPNNNNNNDNDNDNDNYNNIIINKISNNSPKLYLDHQIIINNNDHILIDGVSGSGKTSLLYLFAGIINVEYIDIQPPLKNIYNTTLITLPNYKGLYSGHLNDIISKDRKSVV
jgi:hypothetical protein